MVLLQPLDLWPRGTGQLEPRSTGVEDTGLGAEQTVEQDIGQGGTAGWWCKLWRAAGPLSFRVPCKKRHTVQIN